MVISERPISPWIRLPCNKRWMLSMDRHIWKVSNRLSAFSVALLVRYKRVVLINTQLTSHGPRDHATLDTSLFFTCNLERLREGLGTRLALPTLHLSPKLASSDCFYLIAVLKPRSFVVTLASSLDPLSCGERDRYTLHVHVLGYP